MTENSDSISAISSDDLLRAAFKHHDALVSHAYGLMRDWALAQDVVQETFIVLQKKHGQYRPGESLYAWMRQMVRYEALNALRKRGKEMYVGDEQLFTLVDQQFEAHMDAEAAAALEKEKKALHHCMGLMDKNTIQLLLGFYRDRLDCQQLGALHRRSVNAVRLILSRTRVKLRDCVKKRLRLPEGAA